MRELSSTDPRKVGPYRLLARLGSGGMGEVFLGRSPGGRTVAVKLVRPELAEDTRFCRRFAQEVVTARRVGGFYTAQVVDADTESLPPWLVTSYIPGPTLREAIARHGPLPSESVAALGAGLAEGLRAIHVCDVVHRDLKPGNVILAEDGPRIIDFGIARALDATSHLTHTGVIGTPAFMSPEQIRGREAGPASDIFCLAAVLVYAATGRGPFGEGTAESVLYRVVHEEPDVSGVPTDLAPLLSAGLAKDPEDRPDITAFLNGCAALAGDTGLRLPAGVTEMIDERAARTRELTTEASHPPTAVEKPTQPPQPPEQPRLMTPRQVMVSFSALLLGLFVALLSGTDLSIGAAMIADLHGSQDDYNWLYTSGFLAIVVSMPVWGKLADLTDKKPLVQLSLVTFMLGSAGTGLSQSIGLLIASRVVQCLGIGGLAVLVQAVLASLVPPPKRGGHTGYLGAVTVLGTFGGSLLGSVLVDTSWSGWRWILFAAVLVALAALIVVQCTLRLPVTPRRVRVDYPGAVLGAVSVSLLLVWASLADNKFDWWSWQTAVMVPGAVTSAVLFVLVERRVAEPIMPTRLFRDRTVSLAVIAGLAVGVALFGVAGFLGTYFEMARGDSPVTALLTTLPLLAGLLLSSTMSGHLIAAYDRRKPVLVCGGVLLVAGLGLMGTVHADTTYDLLACYMFLVGCGVGTTAQNLVLLAQDAVDVHEVGTAGAVVAFSRTLGGLLGVNVLGAVLASKVSAYVVDGVEEGGISVPDGGTVSDVSSLPAPLAALIEDSYGRAMGVVFLVAAAAACVALAAILCIKEIPVHRAAPPAGAGRQGAQRAV
ncbi:bifunctional serine/threonine protein kinase/MFS transporter [Streptomyces salinarius]|uniref:bifunctional serine/threonine protein kinase/MFS transporter n=1 Tax=Streptomyces salinarius TaxID=2762598 RepID=UPI003F468EAB